MRCFEPGLLVSYAASQRGITHKRARGRARDVRFTAHNALTNRLSKCAPPSRRVASVDASTAATPTLLQHYTARHDRRAAAAMDDAKRIAESALKTAKKYADESPLQTLRLIEWGCCFLAWTLLASAHRSKFDGLYEYQNYTPLTFLLSGLVMDFLKLPALYVAEHGFRVDQALLRKVELYGSMYMTAWLGIGFIAAASASSVLT